MRITVIFTNSAGCIPNIHPFAPFTFLVKKLSCSNKAYTSTVTPQQKIRFLQTLYGIVAIIINTIVPTTKVINCLLKRNLLVYQIAKSQQWN